MRSEYGDGELPRRPNLTFRAWIAICDGHREVYATQLQLQYLRAARVAADIRVRRVVHAMTRGGVLMPGQLVPYDTAFDDALEIIADVQAQLSGNEIIYDALRAHWAAEVGNLLEGKKISATATARNTDGFEIHTQHGALLGVRARQVEGLYHSFDPLNATLQLGSERGGVHIQLVTPGDIYQRQANIEVHD